MLSRDSRISGTKRLCFDAFCVSAALLLSYIETLLPLSLLIPLPGIKLGLANIAVILVFFCVSRADAAAVSYVRITLSALLFGSVVSFIFSLFGAVLSYIVLILLQKPLENGKLSFVGVSVLCAVMHGAGQILAASLLYTPAAFSYLGFLIIAGVISGCTVGVLSNLIIYRIGWRFMC